MKQFNNFIQRAKLKLVVWRKTNSVSGNDNLNTIKMLTQKLNRCMLTVIFPDHMANVATVPLFIDISD